MGMIFRTDDVSMNTNFDDLKVMHDQILEMFPQATIWSCVNIFSKACSSGAVYPNPPFKDKDLKFFLNVDQMMSQIGAGKSKVVSHGLWHFDHSAVSRDLQEASILTSCKFLQTRIFIPPFNRYNQDTVDICRANTIEFVRPDGWKSMEHNEFDPKHNRWYFHAWKWTPETFFQYLEKAFQKAEA